MPIFSCFVDENFTHPNKYFPSFRLNMKRNEVQKIYCYYFFRRDEWNHLVISLVILLLRRILILTQNYYKLCSSWNQFPYSPCSSKDTVRCYVSNWKNGKVTRPAHPKDRIVWLDMIRSLHLFLHCARYLVSVHVVLCFLSFL